MRLDEAFQPAFADELQVRQRLSMKAQRPALGPPAVQALKPKPALTNGSGCLQVEMAALQLRVSLSPQRPLGQAALLGLRLRAHCSRRGSGAQTGHHRLDAEERRRPAMARLSSWWPRV